MNETKVIDADWTPAEPYLPPYHTPDPYRYIARCRRKRIRDWWRERQTKKLIRRANRELLINAVALAIPWVFILALLVG